MKNQSKSRPCIPSSLQDVFFQNLRRKQAHWLVLDISSKGVFGTPKIFLNWLMFGSYACLFVYEVYLKALKAYCVKISNLVDRNLVRKPFKTTSIYDKGSNFVMIVCLKWATCLFVGQVDRGILG